MDSPSPSRAALDVAAAIRRAEECLDLETPPRAACILQELNSLFPLEARLWHLRGLAAEELGSAGEAEEHYRMALRLSPADGSPGAFDCALDLAELLIEEGREAEGATLAEGLARSHPHAARPLAVLGHARMAEGKPLEAETALRRALELEPELSWVGRELAGVLCRRGDLPGAAEVLLGILERSPQDALTHACLGCVERRRGDEGAAEACFRRALCLDFSVDSAFRGLYDLLVRTHRAAEAHELLEEGLRRLYADPVEAKAGPW